MIRSDDLVPSTDPAPPCGCMALDPPARRPLGRAASDMAIEMRRLAHEVDTAVSVGTYCV